MQVEYHAWESPILGRKSEMKVYGHWGRPILVFPCAGGNYFEFEDFGMVETIQHYIDSGAVKVFTIGSLDGETLLASHRPAGDRMRRHEDFHRYLMEEVVPFIYHQMDGAIPITVFGCSLGAYHAVNFALRHPDMFTSVIALSGVYSLSHFVGAYMDDNVYFNSPLDYLPRLEDPWFLERYRRNDFLICCGQGAWENECLADTRALGNVFANKDISAWVDFWGYDVNHDWPWWRKQFPHFLGHLLEKR
ncbi:MAG: esterase family protein [Candidatus Riflebacteria bacterium]|nr:esterase family protein [Candidatus Riflebacteria bacterium]